MLQKKGWSISEITTLQMCAIMTVVKTASNRCFQDEHPESSEKLISGADFCCVMTKGEKAAMDVFCNEYNAQIPLIAENITARKNNKIMKSFYYKKWYCQWLPKEQVFYLFTPEEMEQPKGFRYFEFECQTAKECKIFINNY